MRNAMYSSKRIRLILEEHSVVSDDEPTPVIKKTKRRKSLSELTDDEQRIVQDAATAVLNDEHVSVLLYDLKNAIVDQNWPIVQAILSIFLKNPLTDEQGMAILESSAMKKNLPYLQRMKTEDTRAIISRICKFTILLIVKIRDS